MTWMPGGFDLDTNAVYKLPALNRLHFPGNPDTYINCSLIPHPISTQRAARPQMQLTDPNMTPVRPPVVYPPLPSQVRIRAPPHEPFSGARSFLDPSTPYQA